MAYKKANKLHIVAVTAVIRNEEGKFLVMKRAEHEVAAAGMYAFPGGKVEDNEAIEEALANEIEEETGLKMKPGKILLKDVSFVRPDGQTVKVLAYLCQTETTDNVVISEDFSDYKWISRSDLNDMNHVGIEGELEHAERLLNAGIDLSTFMTESVRKEPEPAKTAV